MVDSGTWYRLVWPEVQFGLGNPLWEVAIDHIICAAVLSSRTPYAFYLEYLRFSPFVFSSIFLSQMPGKTFLCLKYQCAAVCHGTHQRVSGNPFASSPKHFIIYTTLNQKLLQKRPEGIIFVSEGNDLETAAFMIRGCLVWNLPTFWDWTESSWRSFCCDAYNLFSKFQTYLRFNMVVDSRRQF